MPRSSSTTLLFAMLVACASSRSHDSTNVNEAGSGGGGAGVHGSSEGPRTDAGRADAGGSSGVAGAAGPGAVPVVDAGRKDGAPSGAGDAAARTDAGRPSRMPLAKRVCPTGASFGDPLPSDRKAVLVQGGFGFLEGPVWLDAQGVLLFSDMDFNAPADNGPPSRIRRLTPPASFDVFLENAGTNGLALDTDGAVLGCSHALQDIVRISPTNPSALNARAFSYQGKRFDSPNDLTVRSDGSVYFTDPDWQLGKRTSEIGFTGVYRATTDLDVTLITGTLDRPNGIALSLDESILYVGSSGNDVLAFPLGANGVAGSPTTFASAGATDGMAVDCAGNLYVAAGSEIRVYTPAGTELGAISVPMTPSNAAFGGADHQTLYITAQSALYSLHTQVPGLPY
jgi:gluconolactonase